MRTNDNTNIADRCSYRDPWKIVKDLAYSIDGGDFADKVADVLAEMRGTIKPSMYDMMSRLSQYKASRAVDPSTGMAYAPAPA
jgi:hypothetical protein